jgi:hypothetical protein
MHHPFETYIMTHILNPATTSELHENVKKLNISNLRELLGWEPKV